VLNTVEQVPFIPLYMDRQGGLVAGGKWRLGGGGRPQQAGRHSGVPPAPHAQCRSWHCSDAGKPYSFLVTLGGLRNSGGGHGQGRARAMRCGSSGVSGGAQRCATCPGTWGARQRVAPVPPRAAHVTRCFCPNIIAIPKEARIVCMPYPRTETANESKRRRAARSVRPHLL
jgi:hypothetical protein